MTTFRTTQVFAGLIGDFGPAVRASTTLIEVMYDADPALRASTTLIEVMYDADPLVRFSTSHIDIIYDADPTLQITQYHLEVLYAPPVPRPLDNFPHWATPSFKWAPVEYGEKWPPKKVN